LHTLIPHLAKPPRFCSYRALFLETVQLDPHLSGEAELSACARAHGIHMNGDMPVQSWRDLLLTHCIEPQFPTDQLTFVYHYPASQSALAKVTTVDEQTVAERFEVYLGALELGNGYQEQTDSAQNRLILVQDAHTRGNDIPVDERFLAALEQGLPECAGVALGIDRILMCRMQVNDLKQVIAFPWEVA
jgi:lysyl-tRNA synthetase class 2